MPQAVYIIWAVLLILVILALPWIIMFLHRTLRNSREIANYFAEMYTAGAGIAQNTGNIKALEETIKVAGVILETAGQINTHTETIKTTLAARVK